MVSVVLAAVAGIAAVVAVVLLRRLREAERRIARATARLEGRPSMMDASLDSLLGALEEAVAVAETRSDVSLSAERLGRALDAIPQGVVICDESARVVFENEGGSGFSGARHGDALVAAAVGNMLAAAVNGDSEIRTIELYGPPRRTLVIASYPLPARTAPGTHGALVVIDDVTERRRLELVRRDFVANISHELKTPIGALALLAETLMAEEDVEDRERLTRRMLEESHRVGRTIDDLLALSRIEAEQDSDRVPVEVVVAEVVEEAVARATSAAEQNDITVRVSTPPELRVLGDARQLVSALFNLLDNAVKYSDPGTSVEVTATLDGEWVDCVVADHGPGIPRRDRERIFERFYRVDRARSRQTGGTGLGLAIVRHVATNHGGTVDVESGEGEGARFTLRLPAAPEVETGRAGAREDAAADRATQVERSHV